MMTDKSNGSIHDIVIAALVAGGYDGICSQYSDGTYECACLAERIKGCSLLSDRCYPGYRRDVPGSDHGWIITRTKPGPTADRSDWPQWLLDAETQDADVEIINGFVHWYNGRWLSGRWADGVWYQGSFVAGTWESGEWLDGRWAGGEWVSGEWFAKGKHP